MQFAENKYTRWSHCDKQCTPGNYAQWHGDNCKKKGTV